MEKARILDIEVRIARCPPTLSRERERYRERVCVCVRVCARERERERAREREVSPRESEASRVRRAGTLEKARILDIEDRIALQEHPALTFGRS